MSSPSTVETPHHKRKRSQSHSPEVDGAPPSSRRRSKSPPDATHDVDSRSTKDLKKSHQLEARVAAIELSKSELNEKDQKLKEKDRETAQRAEFAKLLNTRSGGMYIPPARLRAMQEAASADKTSAEYQRLSWDALRKSITGIVNRVNITNIKQIVPELFSENLIRGRGLFARSIMKAQAASLPFTPVFAALVAIINTKLPQVGELVLTRIISQFRKSFKRNNKIVCQSTTTFLAHLVNQSVAHEVVALQILVLLLERPTDDSIEIAVGFTREVGAFLSENSPKANATVFERFRAVLNEGKISQRVQYMIEVLMQVRKDKYKDNPILPEGLDLVEEDEQITHQIQLDEELDVQDSLNIFKFDSQYLENEDRYKSIKAEILGEDSDDESGSGSEEEDSEEDDEVAETKEGIEDRTETNLVNLRRIIYLTIMNALNYEEAVHKLLKIQIQEGQEIELVNMIIECCSQERSYSTFYGLIGERFCKLNRVWTDSFESAFNTYYTTIHRYETNRLRNIARFFGHLFATDSISWMVFECVRINEDDTTSSSRIFVKIMMQEMMEGMGLKTLAERFKDPEVKRGCEGMFPMDVPKNTRFAINYFTSIGLGAITEEMREYLKVMHPS
ncbi:MIF4G-domain-containing protein [Phlegmacium glaucopus]|nr:MIF4G-domain-containing protein [Phlegmacium glaucopus]